MNSLSPKTQIPLLEIGVATDPGRKRRDEPNQDALLVLPVEAERPPLLIVADGMGGYKGGAEASRLIVAQAAAHYRQADFPVDLPNLLRECLFAAHQALIERAAADPELASMGTTAALAVIDGEKVYAANVGDSRIYLLRGREITQLSYDHSVVADQVRAGALTPLQARRSPKRNRLTQSISPKRKEITPYVTEAAFGEGDVLLLCSDGLWGVVSESVIQVVALELPPQQAAEKLVALTLASGAPDNVTVVIARRAGASHFVLSGEDETNPGL